MISFTLKNESTLTSNPIFLFSQASKEDFPKHLSIIAESTPFEPNQAFTSTSTRKLLSVSPMIFQLVN